ncbi:MAG: hypothetical protein SEPTF4163_001858 [Sporothrix epigloea]
MPENGGNDSDNFGTSDGNAQSGRKDADSLGHDGDLNSNLNSAYKRAPANASHSTYNGHGRAKATSDRADDTPDGAGGT